MSDFKKICVTFSILKLKKYDAYQNWVEFCHKAKGNDVKWPHHLFFLLPPLWKAKEVQAMLEGLEADVDGSPCIDTELRYVDAFTNTSLAPGYLSDNKEVPIGNHGVGDVNDGLGDGEVDNHGDAQVPIVSCDAAEMVAVPSCPGSHWCYYTALGYTSWRR